MIRLKNDQPFARGNKRACYFHPLQPDRCVKVLLPDQQPAMLRKQVSVWRRLRPKSAFDENIQECRQLERLARKLGPECFRHLPVVDGIVDTDLGPGLVVELIRDADGSISLSGKEFTIKHGILPESWKAMEELLEFLMAHTIPIRDPFAHNLSFQRRSDGTIRAVVIGRWSSMASGGDP